MSVRKAILFVCVAELAIGLLALNNYGWTLEGLQAVTRFSGRLSLLLFSFIFLFHKGTFDLSEWLSPHYFLVFAVAHGIHLLELLSYVYLSQIPLVPHRLAGGFLAYVFIFVMPLVHHRYLNDRITERRFNTTVLVYLYYVWFVFFMTYMARVQGTFPNAGGNYYEHVVLLGWVSLMLGMRIQRFAFKRLGR